MPINPIDSTGTPHTFANPMQRNRRLWRYLQWGPTTVAKSAGTRFDSSDRGSFGFVDSGVGMVPRNRRVTRGLKILVCLVTLVLSLPSIAPGYAQSEIEYSIPTGLTADLPAMTLSIDEIPVDGLGQEYGMLQGVDRMAEVLAPKMDESFENVREQLTDIGWLGRYYSPYAIPMESAEGQWAVVVASIATQYEDVNGARQGFSLPVVEAGESEEVDAPKIGDESKFVQTTRERDSDGRSYVVLNYTVRIGAIIGTLAIFYYDDGGIEPATVAEMTEAAEAMAHRIETSLDDPSLPMYSRILRADSDPGLAWWRQHDYFLMKDGEYIRRYDVSDSGNEAQIVFNERTGVVDKWVYVAWFREYDDADVATLDAVYMASIATFETNSEAEAFARTEIDDYIDIPGTFDEMVELKSIPGNEGDLLGFAYQDTTSLGNKVHGFRLYLQVGKSVVTLSLESNEDVDLDDVVTLLRAQEACVGQPAFCEPLPIADLVK
jgi:hypothetical protein